MKELFDDFRLWLSFLFMHSHKYSLDGLATYSGPETSSIPVVAWFYMCKCGSEIVEVDRSGVELLQKGVDYKKLIENRI
jgi:hypothetical protein